LDLAFGYDHTKILCLEYIKLAFLWFEVHAVFVEDLHDVADLTVMLIEVFGEYEDVFQVDKYVTLGDLDLEDVVHHRLERCRHCTQA
jgi:hypothetical protein